MGWLNRITKGVEELGKNLEEGVNRATSEADKALKINRLTGEINNKRAELDRAFADIGRAVWAAYQSGTELPEEITRSCASIASLERDIADLETQREAIKGQQVPPQGQGGTGAPAQPMGQDYDASGATAPSATPSSQAAAMAEGLAAQSAQAEGGAGTAASTYGEAEAVAEQTPRMAFCPGCGKSLPEGVAFCPNCGRQVA